MGQRFSELCKKTGERKTGGAVWRPQCGAYWTSILPAPNPTTIKSPGYTQVEIDGLDNLIDSGFVDTFRHKYPDRIKYSWWSYRAGAREKNVGWRIDYFLVSQILASNIKNAEILNKIMGSDHCPVLLELAIGK